MLRRKGSGRKIRDIKDPLNPGANDDRHREDGQSAVGAYIVHVVFTEACVSGIIRRPQRLPSRDHPSPHPLARLDAEVHVRHLWKAHLIATDQGLAAWLA